MLAGFEAMTFECKGPEDHCFSRLVMGKRSIATEHHSAKGMLNLFFQTWVLIQFRMQELCEGTSEILGRFFWEPFCFIAAMDLKIDLFQTSWKN